MKNVSGINDGNNQSYLGNSSQISLNILSNESSTLLPTGQPSVCNMSCLNLLGKKQKYQIFKNLVHDTDMQMNMKNFDYTKEMLRISIAPLRLVDFCMYLFSMENTCYHR